MGEEDKKIESGFSADCAYRYQPGLPVTNSGHEGECRGGFTEASRDEATTIGGGFRYAETIGRAIQDTYVGTINSHNHISPFVYFDYTKSTDIDDGGDTCYEEGRSLSVSFDFLKLKSPDRTTFTNFGGNKSMFYGFSIGNESSWGLREWFDGFSMAAAFVMSLSSTALFNADADYSEYSFSPFRLVVGAKVSLDAFSRSELFTLERDFKPFKRDTYLIMGLGLLLQNVVDFFFFSKAQSSITDFTDVNGTNEGGQQYFGSLQFTPALKTVISGMATGFSPLVSGYFQADAVNDDTWQKAYGALEAVIGAVELAAGLGLQSDGGGYFLTKGLLKIETMSSIALYELVDSIGRDDLYIPGYIIGAVSFILGAAAGRNFAGDSLQSAGISSAGMWAENHYIEDSDYAMRAYSPAAFTLLGQQKDMIGVYYRQTAVRDSMLRLGTIMGTPALSVPTLGELGYNTFASPINETRYTDIDGPNFTGAGIGIGGNLYKGDDWIIRASAMAWMLSSYESSLVPGLGISGDLFLGYRVSRKAVLGIGANLLGMGIFRSEPKGIGAAPVFPESNGTAVSPNFNLLVSPLLFYSHEI